jgi:hypothetical protein
MVEGTFVLGMGEAAVIVCGYESVASIIL